MPAPAAGHDAQGFSDPRISLRRLEIFCLVVELGSVTRAAEHLLVAQPAVSSQVKVLEDWAGAKLFVRSGNHLELSEAGRRTHVWAQEVLARTLEVRRELHGLGDGSSGAALLSATMGVGTYLLSPLLTRFRVDRPHADLTVHVVSPQEALRAVETGESDLAVLSGHENPTPPSLAEEHLGDVPIVLCGAPDGPPGNEVRDPRAIAALPHVAGANNRAFQQSVDRQLRAHDLHDVNVAIRLGHASAMKRAVREHGWLVWLPHYCVEPDVAEGTLRIIDVPGVRLFDRLTLYQRQEKSFSRLQQDVVDAVRARVTQLAGATPGG